MLHAVAPELWVAEQPMRVLGVDVGARMSVVRLAGERLFVHSPIACRWELRAALEALGSVRFVVAPNRFHHVFAGEWVRAYPGARLFGAPGLERKRRDLAFDGMLGDAAPPEWREEIDQTLFHGYPLANEVVFHHRASRTLLLADLAVHIGPESPWPTRLGFRLVGGYGRFGPTRLERWLVRDRAAARASLERILAWDFDRVIVAHGRILESGGRHALETGWAWLPPPPPAASAAGHAVSDPSPRDR